MPVSYRKSGTSFLGCQDTRRVVRVVYGGGLENRCTARYRGFESLTLRNAEAKKRNRASSLRFFDDGLQAPPQAGRDVGGRSPTKSRESDPSHPRYPLPLPPLLGRGARRQKPSQAPPQAARNVEERSPTKSRESEEPSDQVQNPVYNLCGGFL